MPSRLDFDLGFGRSAGARPRDDGAPMRLLLLGDFGGRASRGASDPAGLAQRAVTSIDIDDLEKVMQRLAPQVRVGGSGGEPALEVSFSSLDDFHPDALFRRLPLFQRLRDWRQRLNDGKQFAAAAAELRAEGLASGTAAAAAPTAAPAAAPAESDGGTLERLLGRPATGAAAPAAAAAAGGSAIDALIRRIVAPHIVADQAPFQAQYLAALDAAIGGQMRALLHAPAFRAVEMAWRGAHWLTTQLELGEELKLYVLDASREELAADIAAAGGDLLRSGLLKRLRATGADAPDGTPWSMVVGLFEFGPSAGDQSLLASLGAIAAAAGGPFVAGAAPSLYGCPSPAQLPEPATWTPPAGEAALDWIALRRSELGRWIGLTAPRLLLRQPYGAATDPVEGFAFEEQPPGAPVHETLAWAPGSLAVALLAAQAYAGGGWGEVPGPGGDVADLPAYVYTSDGDKQLMPNAEAPIGEKAGQTMLGLGLIPLLSHRHRAAVRVLRIQSIADPAQPLQFG